MAWDTEMVGILRNMLDDTEMPYTYPDERLQQVIISSAQIVKLDARIFATIYTTNFDNLTITPDPTEASTRDEVFMSLVLLKSACFVAKAEARKAVKQGFLAKEFQTMVDNRDKAKNQISLIDKGWCKDYDDSLLAFIAGEAMPGRAILGPFTVYFGR